MSIVTTTPARVKLDSTHATRLVGRATPGRPDVAARFHAARARAEARRDAAIGAASGPVARGIVLNLALARVGRLRAAAGRAGASRKAICATSTVEIDAKSYAWERAQGDEGERVVRLTNVGDPEAVYDVSRGADGLVACTCPDYTYRRAGTATLCRHGLACVALGLVEAPAPVIRTTRAADVATDDVAGGRRAPTSGPSAEDVAHEQGRAAYLDSFGSPEPPAGLSPTERAAFLAGAAEGRAYDRARS